VGEPKTSKEDIRVKKIEKGATRKCRFGKGERVDPFGGVVTVYLRGKGWKKKRWPVSTSGLRRPLLKRESFKRRTLHFIRKETMLGRVSRYYVWNT